MPRGGVRPGAGRKKGSRDKLTLEREQATQRAAVAVEQVLGEVGIPFTGDAHALLMMVYKDTGLPMDTRLDAAKAAIKFEKPALAATAVMSPEDAAGAPKGIPQDTGQDHLAALTKRYAGGLMVIDGGAKTNGKGNGSTH